MGGAVADVALTLIAKINFVASIVLFMVVIRHYAFFRRGAPSMLKLWIRRVFFADLLMAASVIFFNVTQFFLTPDGYNELDFLRISLKVLQLISVVYACYANIGLFRAIKD